MPTALRARHIRAGSALAREPVPATCMACRCPLVEAAQERRHRGRSGCVGPGNALSAVAGSVSGSRREVWTCLPVSEEPEVPVSGRVFLSEFKRCMTAAGLHVSKIHELRHIGCSLLMANGVDRQNHRRKRRPRQRHHYPRFCGHVLDGRAHEAAETLSFFGLDSVTSDRSSKSRQRPSNGLVSTKVDPIR
jgi:hypothetical protein